MGPAFSQCCFGALVVLGLAACPGCYDGEVLVQQARSSAVKTRLAEIDFGTFRTTLPRDRKNNSFTELELHIFGTVPRYRVPEIKQQLKVEEYRLRHETLAAVRTATRDELAEPSLAQLRQRIEQVVNAVLSDAPVKAIGFYQVTLRER
jgi:hypothetical protein